MSKSYVFTVLFVILTLSSGNVFGAIVSSYDGARSCKIYRSTYDGKPKLDSERNEIDRITSGFSLRNLEIDFSSRLLKLNIEVHISGGFNRYLTKQKVFVQSSNPDITLIINQLNKTFFLLKRVCISSQGELIYVVAND